MIYDTGDLLITSGVIGLLFYYWGWKVGKIQGYSQGRLDGTRITEKRFATACVCEKTGKVTYAKRGDISANV